jgi:hypothetical protein
LGRPIAGPRQMILGIGTDLAIIERIEAATLAIDWIWERND